MLTKIQQSHSPLALSISYKHSSHTVIEGVDSHVLVCVQLSGQLDPNSAVEIVIYTLPDTATICEFLCFLSTSIFSLLFRLSCTKMHTCASICAALDYTVTGLPSLAALSRVNDEHCYNVTIIDDTLIEPSERFFIEFNITGGSDITVMVDSHTEITILDNDGRVMMNYLITCKE